MPEQEASAPRGRAQSPDALLAFVDVGQGDATVAIDFSTREAAIADCPSWGVAAVRQLLADHEVEAVRAVFVTHFDDDHFSGIPQLVDEFLPDKIYATPDTRTSEDRSKPKYRAALSAFADLEDRGVVEPVFGVRDVTGNIGSIAWRLLAPTPGDVMRSSDRARPYRNIASQVIRFDFGSMVALIGGDAPMSTWTKIANQRMQWLPADVFRLSHHGGDLRPNRKTIGVADMLDLVGAPYVAVSVGRDNNHGHPWSDRLHQIRDTGARVLCTQVTPTCHPGLVPTQAMAGAREREEQCAGTVQIRVFDGKWEVDPDEGRHAARIDSWSAPHCRPGCTPKQRGPSE